VARLWVDCFDYQSNTVIITELVFRDQSCMNRMKIEHNVAHNWVDNLSVPKINIFIA
jgi:hypothetical protein